MNITPQQYSLLKQMNYSDEQIKQAATELEQEDKGKHNIAAQFAQAQNRQAQAANVSRVVSPYATQDHENMNKWRLDVDGTLERLYHLFRSDILVIENGQKVYKDNPNPEKRKLNETGTADCMELLTTYLNKEVFLGNYDEDQIRQIVLDISIAFRDLIYMNYERYGWVDQSDDTGGQKRTYYRTMVLQVSNIIYAAYMRAWKGGERQSLNENRNVIQNEQINPGMGGVNINNNMANRERSFINPMRYLKGRYY